MICEVDDSGWGDLIGGVILTFNLPASGKAVFKEIPVECFQGRAFSDKEYLRKSAELADEAVRELGLTPEKAEFRICTGYVNNAVADRLTSRGFKVIRTKIIGRTQELGEKAFENQLKQITGFQTFPPSSNRFFTLLNWVKVDLERRERFVKTGWRKWREQWRGSTSEVPSQACINCRWLRSSGPNTGCFYNGQYQRWLGKSKLKAPTDCGHWETKTTTMRF